MPIGSKYFFLENKIEFVGIQKDCISFPHKLTLCWSTTRYGRLCETETECRNFAVRRLNGVDADDDERVDARQWWLRSTHPNTNGIHI